ncbi:hypothetical protein STEG23_012227 [Scotinomys teguina]
MATPGSEPQAFTPALSVTALHPHLHQHHQHHGSTGGAGFNLPLNRGLERALEEAANSGGLNLSARKLKEFPRTAAPGHDLSDTVQAGVPPHDNVFPAAPTCDRHVPCLYSMSVGSPGLQPIKVSVLTQIRTGVGLGFGHGSGKLFLASQLHPIVPLFCSFTPLYPSFTPLYPSFTPLYPCSAASPHCTPASPHCTPASLHYTLQLHPIVPLFCSFTPIVPQLHPIVPQLHPIVPLFSSFTPLVPLLCSSTPWPVSSAFPSGQ